MKLHVTLAFVFCAGLLKAQLVTYLLQQPPAQIDHFAPIPDGVNDLTETKWTWGRTVFGRSTTTIGPGVDINKAFSLSGSQGATTISGATLNNMATLDSIHHIPVTCGPSSVLTSIAGGVDGRVVLLSSTTASSANLTITNNDPLGATGNRILTGTGGPILLRIGACVQLRHDGNFWRIEGEAPGGAPDAVPLEIMQANYTGGSGADNLAYLRSQNDFAGRQISRFAVSYFSTTSAVGAVTYDLVVNGTTVGSVTLPTSSAAGVATLATPFTLTATDLIEVDTSTDTSNGTKTGLRVLLF